MLEFSRERLMSPPDLLCHRGVRTRQQQLCLSHGDPKLPCTQHPIPGCMVGQAARGSLVSNTASTLLPAPCRGVGSPSPGDGHLAASPGRHTSAPASRCCGHPWAPQTARPISAALRSRCALCIFFVTILWHTVHLSDFLFLHCLMLIKQYMILPTN